MDRRQHRGEAVKKDIGTIRAFICLELPKHVRDTIDVKATSLLKKTGARCSWVKPGNLHLTLKFLGDIPESIVPKLAAALEKVVAKAAPLSLSLKDVGTFGGRNPRVIWVGIGGETVALEEMANAVDRAVANLGFPREKRRFGPHLTIARVRESKSAKRLLEKIEEIELPNESFIADRVTLMKSTLSTGGSIYEPQAEFSLSDQFE